MALIIRDRVKETTTTTGTGALALGGALTGFRTFSSVCAVGDTVYYAVQGVDASGNPTGEWEVGSGTYSATNTLSRTTVLASSNSNAAVSFSAGTKQVWIDFVAQQLIAANQSTNPVMPKLTILSLAASQTITQNVWSAVSWTTTVQDDVSAFSSGSPTVVTVPTGYTRVRVTFYTVWASSSTGQRFTKVSKTSGGTTTDLKGSFKGAVNESPDTTVTRWLTVSPGDTLTVSVLQNTTGTLALAGASSGLFSAPADVQFEWMP